MSETPPRPRAETDERRGGADRRRYNRRQQSSEMSTAPPYYEALDRIAGALEGIEQLIRGGSIVLPEPAERVQR